MNIIAVAYSLCMQNLTMLMLVTTIIAAIVGARDTYSDSDSDDHEIRLPEVIRPWHVYEEEKQLERKASHELINTVSIVPAWRSQGMRGRVPVNVDSFGAVGDGATDDTLAFRQAWDKACSLKNAVFLVPEQRRYRVNATKFNGPCEDRLIVQALTIDSSTGIKVKGLTIQSAQQMHFTISRSDAIRVSGIRVKSPRDSPNTDGIHISESTNVVIQNCNIGTGDDCISIVNASSNIKMKNIVCGPGHGISIGSLGKDNSTAIVTGIVLDTATLIGTTNGLRIKTWQGGSGYVKSVRFENVKMNDVENPIIIDQFYCDSPFTCKNQTSAVKISQVIYRNISGTSETPKAMKFACSDTVPCSGIVLNNINLERENGTAETFCNSAMGFDYGFVRPTADCLNYDKKSRCDSTVQGDNQKPTLDHPLHTEL